MRLTMTRCADTEPAMVDVERELEAGRDCWHCEGTGKVRTLTGRKVDCSFCRGTGKNPRGHQVTDG